VRSGEHAENALKELPAWPHADVGTARVLVGILFHEIGEYEKALENYRKAGEEFKEAEDGLRLASALLNMGSALRDLGRFEDARNHVQHP
jgi:tetratricopeptide (TPR) repeat protein